MPAANGSGYHRPVVISWRPWPAATARGFHLNGPFEPLIPRVLADLGAMSPQVVVPAHCTGWRAQHAISARFGSRYIPNAVGTRFHL